MSSLWVIANFNSGWLGREFVWRVLFSCLLSVDINVFFLTSNYCSWQRNDDTLQCRTKDAPLPGFFFLCVCDQILKLHASLDPDNLPSSNSQSARPLWLNIVLLAAFSSPWFPYCFVSVSETDDPYRFSSKSAVVSTRLLPLSPLPTSVTSRRTMPPQHDERQ